MYTQEKDELGVAISKIVQRTDRQQQQQQPAPEFLCVLSCFEKHKIKKKEKVLIFILCFFFLLLFIWEKKGMKREREITFPQSDS
jgi:hypothetical protein